MSDFSVGGGWVCVWGWHHAWLRLVWLSLFAPQGIRDWIWNNRCVSTLGNLVFYLGPHT
jgi:hypothetical protein